ncbi:MAG: hypothetical protein ACXW11_03485 [Methylotenera sp.]
MYLSRSQLYELVWSKPITTLAKEYGFSDVGFSKICRRHNIPLPPSGYWARVSAGFKVPKPPLPHPHRDGTVYIPPMASTSDDAVIQKKIHLAKEKSEIERIVNIPIPQQIIDPHKFTQNTQLYFEKLIKKIESAQKSKSLPSNYMSIVESVYRGRLVCHEAGCFNVSVSESLVDRAISFLDGLVKELESRDFKIKSDRDEKAGNFVGAIKDNEHISFKISEGYKYQDIKKDSKHRTELDRLLYSGKEPVPTGKLTFSVFACEMQIGRNWTDGKRLIEAELPAIVHEFISLVPCQKQRRIDEAIRKEQREEEGRFFRERESQRYFEQSIYEEALRESEIFKSHKELDTYLNHLEVQYLEQYGAFNERAHTWISTARKIANAKNPVSRRLKILNKS